MTILAIDRSRVTFRNDEPDAALPTSGVGTLEATTIWVDGETRFDSPPTLEVGQQLGLATTQDSAGVDHVAFVDVSARAGDKPPEKAAPAAGLRPTPPTGMRRPPRRARAAVPSCRLAPPRSRWPRSPPSTPRRSP